MNKRRRYRAVLVLGTVGLLLTVACGLWVRSERRQEALDRQLIAALVKQDTAQALGLVNAGADPNTLCEPLPPPSFLQLWNSLLYHAPLPVNGGNTAFCLACGSPLPGGGDIIGMVRDSPELVRSMIQHGAHLNTHGDIGFTPLMWAACSDHPQTISVLLDNGAEINAVDKAGDTALMRVASQRTSPRTMTLLLHHGANLNLSNKDGETALRLAQDDSQTDLIALLKQAGAKK
jgi:hypothetical protein